MASGGAGNLGGVNPFRIASCLVLLSLGAAGCGDDSDAAAGGGSAGSSSASSGATTASDASSTSEAQSGAGGDGGASGGGGSGGSGGSDGCAPVDLPDLDDDTSVRGPFDVGARTVTVDGLTVEVWYPASGVPDDRPAKQYDIRDHLPASEVDKIADEDTPLQTCDCFADVEMDATRGPFPVVLFVHGTAGFRSQSLEIVTHWASRGFVVLAADHPGLQLHDLLALACGQGNTPRDLDADLATLVAAIQSPAGDLAFLDGRIDAKRLALSGHSAGAAAIQGWGDVGKVLIPMAAGGVEDGAALESTLVLGALDDQVVDYENQEAGFASSPSPKRLVGLAPAGHLIFSSLCSIRNDADENIVEVGTAAGVCGLALADGLFDCSDDYMPDETGWTIIHDATSAVLEETLLCLPQRGPWVSDIASRYPEVGAFEEDLGP